MLKHLLISLCTLVFSVSATAKELSGSWKCTKEVSDKKCVSYLQFRKDIVVFNGIFLFKFTRKTIDDTIVLDVNQKKFGVQFVDNSTMKVIQNYGTSNTPVDTYVKISDAALHKELQEKE